MGENALDRMVRRCRSTGIVRFQQRRWMAGVCVGLGVRYRVDPVLFRVGFLLLSIFGGIGVAVYLTCWLLLPTSDGTVSLERALRGGDLGALTLLMVTVVCVVGSLTPGATDTGTSFLGLIALVLIVWLLGRRDASASAGTEPVRSVAVDAPTRPLTDATVGSTPRTTEVPHPQAPVAAAWPSPPATPLPSLPGADVQDVRAGRSAAPVAQGNADAPRVRTHRRQAWSITLITLGAATLAYLVGGALTSNADRSWLVSLACALGVLGASLVVTAFLRLRPPLVAIAAWLVGITLILSTAAGPADDGDVQWRPITQADVRAQYSAGVGQAVLDLTAAPPPKAVRDITVSQGVGDLTILVPGAVSTTIEPRLGLGTLYIGNTGESSGARVGSRDPVTVGSGPAAYRIRVDAGVGDLTVRVAATAPPTTPSPTGTPSTTPTRRASTSAARAQNLGRTQIVSTTHLVSTIPPPAPENAGTSTRGGSPR